MKKYEKEKAIAGLRFDHARRCKKELKDCEQCSNGVEWFKTLPLGTLSKVLEERQ